MFQLNGRPRMGACSLIASTILFFFISFPVFAASSTPTIPVAEEIVIDYPPPSEYPTSLPLPAEVEVLDPIAPPPLEGPEPDRYAQPEIPGKFDVANSGAAVYSIPIEVPPGVNGMKPSLSMVYSSQGGNGVMGLGWSLSGISVITRCPKTFAQDGEKLGVQLNNTDRYCMNGQRLVPADGNYANYGVDGKEYRTEIDNFTKIVSHGSVLSSNGLINFGPIYFTAKTAMGRTLEFGNTTDSQFNINITSGNLSGQKPAVKWAINKVEDNSGNDMTYEYTEDVINGVHQIKKINYYNISSVYNQSVIFNYSTTDRADPIYGYLHGAKVSITKTLGSIQINSKQILLSKYFLFYDIDYLTNNSKIKLVQQCNWVTTVMGVAPDCKQNKTFDWKNVGRLEFEPATQFNYDFGTNTISYLSRKFVDVTGDGRTDIVSFGDDGVRVAVSNGVTYSTPTVWVKDFGVNYGWRGDRHVTTMADVNGDGKTDIVGFKDDGVYVSTPNKFYYTSRFSTPSKKLSEFGYTAGGWRVDQHPRLMGDVDGDGRDDIVGFGSSNVVIALSTGSGFSKGENRLTGFTYNSGWRVGDHPRMLGDVNGDGMADIIGFQGTNVYVALSKGGGYFTPAKLWVSNFGNTVEYMQVNNPQMLSDVNGDGKQDIVVVVSDGIQVALSTGTKFEAATLWLHELGYNSWGHSSEYPRLMGDVNGDGRQDVVAFSGDGVAVALSNGLNFTKARRWVGDFSVPTTNLFQPFERQVIDVNGDGLADIVGVRDEGMTFATSKAERNYVSTIRDKYNFTNIKLKSYAKGSAIIWSGNNSYPEQSIIPKILVVDSVWKNDGIGGANTNTYKFSDAKLNKHGRGFLGFQRMVIHDDVRGINQTTYYSQKFPYVGRVASTSQKIDGKLTFVTSSENNYSYFGKLSVPTTPIHVFTNKSTSNYYKMNGSLLKTETIEALSVPDYGLYGQPLNQSEVKTTIRDALNTETHTTTVVDEFALPNQFGDWNLGRITRKTVTADNGVEGSLSKETSFSYYSNNETCISGSGICPSGLLKWEKETPDDSANYDANLYLITEYSYDTFGNAVEVSTSGDAAATHAFQKQTSKKTFDYTDPSTPVVKSINALNEVVTQIFDARWGKYKSQTDANLITTERRFDLFGRKVKEVQYAGTALATDHETTWSYIRCDWSSSSNCINKERFYITTNVDGGIPSAVYFDNFGREVRKKSWGSNNNIILNRAVYNADGLVWKQSRDYFYGTPEADIKWTEHLYDKLGRLTTVNGPDGSSTTTAYNGFETTVTRQRVGQNGTVDLDTKKTTNAMGKLVSSVDSDLNEITYTYDSFLNPKTVTDSTMVNTIEFRHDIYGRKTYMNDPDMGEWEYQYDAMGRLRQQQKDIGQLVTIMQYDALNRLKSRTDETSGKTGLWKYYSDADPTAGRCVGQLKSVSSDIDSYTESYTYDKCRIDSVTTNIDGIDHIVSSTYDQYSRLEYLTYPDSGNQGTFVQRNVYDKYGFITKIQDGNVATETATNYWTAIETNAAGNITWDQFGNGISTTRAYDPNTGLLTKIKTGSTAQIQNLSYAFDNLGNLEKRTDVNQKYTAASGVTETFYYDNLNRLDYVNRNASLYRDYTYDAIGNITYKSDVGAYKYDQVNNAGPHAVTSVNGSPNFTYDVSGNMLTGRGKTITYTSFNKPRTIDHPSASIELFYSPDRARYKKITSTDKGTSTLHYVGKIFERNQKSNGVIEYKNYIYAAGQLVAIDTRRSNATKNLRYVHTDHLGSIDVITNELGKVVKRFSFDPFGKQRNFVEWNDGFISDMVNQYTSISTRGFTGHEMLNEVGLIHMNGRVYDPELGRFISADPYIEFGAYSQSLNRYSYVLNNPLSLTDPSGYGLGTKIRGLFKIGAGIALMAYELKSGLACYLACFSAGVTLVMDGVCDMGWGGCEEAEERTQNGAIGISGGFDYDGTSGSGGGIVADPDSQNMPVYYNQNDEEVESAAVVDEAEEALIAHVVAEGDTAERSRLGLEELPTLDSYTYFRPASEYTQVAALPVALYYIGTGLVWTARITWQFGSRIISRGVKKSLGSFSTSARNGVGQVYSSKVVMTGKNILFSNFSVGTQRGLLGTGQKGAAELVGPMKELIKFSQKSGAKTITLTGKYATKEGAALGGGKVGGSFSFSFPATQQGFRNFLGTLRK